MDAFIAQFGQEAFENHIYEYGYCSDSPYTDLWRMDAKMVHDVHEKQNVPNPL